MIGRDGSDSVAQIAQPIRWLGATVFKAIGWNVYDPDNAAYLACFLDAAISAEDAEAEM